MPTIAVVVAYASTRFVLNLPTNIKEGAAGEAFTDTHWRVLAAWLAWLGTRNCPMIVPPKSYKRNMYVMSPMIESWNSPLHCERVGQ